VSRSQLRGLGVSPGIAIAEPVVQETRPISTLRIPIPETDVEREVSRFREAVAVTVERIGENRRRASQQMGEEFAAIFDAHQLIASDPSLGEPVAEIIRSERVNAEWALDRVVERLNARFEALGDAYLADRKLDVLDVATQIMNTLQGVSFGQLKALDRPVILVSDDLPASAAVQLPLDRIRGFALEMGGPTSHTTIIARSLGIPVIVGAHGICEAARHSRKIALDAFEGKILIDPNPAEISEYESRQREYQQQQAQLEHVRLLPSVTRDGCTLQLLANIDLPAEIEHAKQWCVDGIGLFRSEFLYLKMSPALPTEEDHLQAYRELVTKMDGRQVTIRTFDLGGGKLARQMVGNQETNPVLGLRGIRYCLSRREFFSTQLRALLRVAGEFPPGVVRIMFPLVSTIEEVRVARLLLKRVGEQLRSEGHKVPEQVPTGVMVEVPSSAIMARELMREVDFVSIGTNDLIQYTLAVDRSNDLVAGLYNPTNPAVLRLIGTVIAAGQAEGVEVAMCGEMASDPLLVPVLVGLGLRKLSMNPQAVPVVRNLIRQLSYRESVHIAKEVGRMTMARQVEEFLLERMAIAMAKTRIRI